MKNIIWQQPNGAIAVHILAEDADSQAVAVALLAGGTVDPSWSAVLFDQQVFPAEPQSAWRVVGGALTFDPSAIPLPTKDQLIQDVLNGMGRGKDRSLIQTIILFAEKVLIPAAAAQYGVSYEVARADAYARNKTYREAFDTESSIRAIETAP